MESHLNASTSQPTQSGFTLQDTKYYYERIPQTIAYCLLFLVSMVGNSLIVWIIFKDHQLRSTTNVIVANMAVSDLLATLFTVPWNVADINFGSRWLIPNDFGLALCKLVPFLGDTSVGVSLYSCVFIALDRYYAVAHPLKGGFTRSRLKFILPGIWIVSGLIAAPTLYYTGLVWDSYGMAYCRLAYDKPSLYKDHFFAMAALHSGISFPSILTLYVVIVYKLRHHRVPGNQPPQAKRKRQHQNKKVLKMSVCIVSLSCVTWLVYSIFFGLVNEGRLNILDRVLLYNLSFVVMFIAHISFTYNFFICIIFIDSYRENMKTIIKSFCCKHTAEADTGQYHMTIRQEI